MQCKTVDTRSRKLISARSDPEHAGRVSCDAENSNDSSNRQIAKWLSDYYVIKYITSVGRPTPGQRHQIIL